MPIDATRVESPGWWLQRLGKRLLDERADSFVEGERIVGLDTLQAYAEGRPRSLTFPVWILGR